MALRTRADTWPIASAILTITAVVAGFLVLGIVLVLAEANRNNDLVDFVLDVGGWFAGPFHDLFPRRDVKENFVVNWGIATVVYLAVGGLLARLVRWGD